MHQNQLKAIRKDHLLDIKFVCQLLEISIEQCQRFEANLEPIPDNLRMQFERLYGVSKKDIYIDSNVDMTRLKKIKNYDKLSLKDRNAIAKLVQIQNAMEAN